MPSHFWQLRAKKDGNGNVKQNFTKEPCATGHTTGTASDDNNGKVPSDLIGSSDIYNYGTDINHNGDTGDDDDDDADGDEADGDADADTSTTDGAEPGSRPESGRRKRDERAESLANAADDFDSKLRSDRAIAQREAFLFFLTRGATHMKSTSATTPKTVYFSLLFQLATPFGLLGNMASVISLCDHWRMNKVGKTINDKWWVLLLNSLALACGCLANVILFLHAEKWMRRSWSLIGVCMLYMSATFIYMALLGSTEVVYFRHDRHSFSRTSGYWHAVCASVLYFLSSLAIGSNLLYFRNKMWNASMSRRQRRIMILCSFYIAWIAIGGATFQPHSMINIAYSDAAYYCVVSCLTLGYGDIVPKKTLPRALAIPYIYIGLVLGGLATLAIFQASLSSARNESIIVHVEQRRHAALERPIKSEKEGFDTMRYILRSSRERALMIRAVLTTSWLIVFWLVGALILKSNEGWTYFEAFYYVAVSLATVGYGDFTPKSPGGRSFFLYWALLAVPTMTTAVSDMSAVGMQWVQRMRELEEKWRVSGLINAFYWYRDQRNMRAKADPNKETMDTMKERLQSLAMGDLPNSKRWHDITRISALPNDAVFSLETWHTVVCEILGVDDLPVDFWLSDMSPVRFPAFNEREFLLLAALNMLRLSMPDTEHEIAARNAPAAPVNLDTSSTITTNDPPEAKESV